MSADAFIAGDWGTTHLRLFLCDGSSVLDGRSGAGVRALKRTPAEEFATLTQDWIDRHRVARAILSGMVGSRNGWVEVPYVACPASSNDLHGHLHRFLMRDIEIAIVPGLSCTSPLSAPDVMRGEETQLCGALLVHPTLAKGRHIVALPGTHTKWAEIDEGRIVRFQTALTGELFALLKNHSTLLATGGEVASTLDEASFVAGLQSARAPLLHALFQVRSRQLIERMSSAQATGWLSGLLIGADIEAGLQLFDPKEIALIGEPSLAARYGQALALRGINAQMLDANACVLAGLRELAH